MKITSALCDLTGGGLALPKLIGLIQQLQSDPKLRVECPNCYESYPLARIRLFSVASPLPPEAATWVNNKKAEQLEGFAQLRTERGRLRTEPEAKAKAIGIGKALERIAPVLDGFKFEARDCRALFQPIDYIAFNGLSRTGKVDSITFIEVKTGTATESSVQVAIHGLVRRGRVVFQRYDGERL